MGYFNLTAVGFTSPDDGFVLLYTKALSHGEGNWAGEPGDAHDRVLDSTVRVGSRPFFFTAEGLRPGNYSMRIRLVTYGRRIVAQTRAFFSVDSQGSVDSA